MRVTLDSNAWETIFGSIDNPYGPIREAVATGVIEAFICATAIVIEAIRKTERRDFFREPHSNLQIHGRVMRDGASYLHLSFGPDDKRHPGLPAIQVEKLRSARAAGVCLMRGIAWLGLPSPQEARDSTLFVAEGDCARAEREQRQAYAEDLIHKRGVGRAAFESAGGWTVALSHSCNVKEFGKACAEWADGETAAAHIGYQNEILCTNDRGRSIRQSIFDSENRSWLTSNFGVEFATLDEFVRRVAV